jgi:sulfhydrogenase subunit beta (sulfur reductase)
MRILKISLGDRMEKKIEKRALSDWLKRLKDFTVMAPVEIGDHWEYQVISDPKIVELSHSNTVISPKKIIFPQREIFFEFGFDKPEDFKLSENLPEGKPTVVFGVRPCDARALTLMDKVFKGDQEDPYYWKRRRSTILVGLGCDTPPSENCFCSSVGGSPFSHEGLDILMTRIGESYIVQSFGEKGDSVVRAAGDLFRPVSETDRKNVRQIISSAEKKIKRQIKNSKEIPEKLKKMFETEFWTEESMSCIRCGICTYLCPTCHCFDINDEVISTFPLQGKRVRTWDNCQFPDFTMHSSGHNPRPDRASRLRQRILHKFQYFVEIYREFQCTGCGRCISRCPVGIDIVEILNKVKAYEIQ